MTYALACAQGATVWVVAPATGAAYREVVDSLRAELDAVRNVHWATSAPEELTPPTAPPRLIVTVGAAALAKVLAHYSAGTPPPILATLLPRQSFEREIGRATRRPNASAIVLDQPLARQVALIRLALPHARRVGVLLGAESRAQQAALRAALAEQGLVPRFEDSTQRGLLAALQTLLDESDVLLAVADPGVFNGDTIASILTAGYRRQVPLVGFSPAYVKAGALLGLFATPTQVGREAAEAVRGVLVGGALPSARAPREFSIEVNAAVARSLGLVLDAEELGRRARAQEKTP